MGENMVNVIEGFHGTDRNNIDSIINNNYNISQGRNHWLGDGIYFFIKGIEKDTVDLAKKWAIAESWDNNNKYYTYDVYSVLKSDIMLKKDAVLDLTSDSGLEFFNWFRKEHKKKLTKNELRSNADDWTLLELIKKKFNIEIIMAHVYIKFSLERIVKLGSHIPNCTILSLANNSLIDINSIKEVEQGVVKNEI